MTSPAFQIGGLASGLDTTGIVDQLMSLERNPVVLMNQQRSTAQAKINAWSAVTTRMSAVRSEVDKLRDIADFDGFTTASSSNEDAVSISDTSGGLGRLSFVVEQLAEAHQMASTGSFSSTASSVGAGTLTITSGGQDYEFTGETLENLVSEINSNSNIDVTASAVQVGTDDYRLILNSGETGADNQFSVSSDKTLLSSFSTLQAGQNSIVRMGDEATGLRLERQSNTVSDLVPGTTISLRQTTTEPVTVDSSRDLDATVEQVTQFVNSLNAFTTEVDALTRFDPDGDNDGLLIGDATLRDIENRLIASVTSPVDGLGGAVSYAGAFGLDFQADGTFALDPTKLREALEEDYDSVVSFFARSGSIENARAQFSFATDATAAGDYNISITQAASQAQRLGGVFSVPGSDIDMQVVAGETTADITITSGSSIEGAISSINDALSTAGLSFIRATNEGGAVSLTSLRYGSGGDFTVTGSGGLGLDGGATGTDVAGTINGDSATGTGRTLTADDPPEDATEADIEAGRYAAQGLGVTITVTPSELAAAGGTMDLETMSYSRGLMGELSELLSNFEGADGTLAGASQRWESQVDTIDEQIERFEDRLAIRENTLRRQFTAMEQMLANLQGQSNFLLSGLAGAAA